MSNAPEIAVPEIKTSGSTVGYLAAVAASSLVVAYAVRRWGRSLPLPDFMIDWLADDDDEDQDDEDDDQ